MHRSFLPGVCVAMMAGSALAGAPLAEWQYRQEVTVPTPGLTKLNLPPATLDAAQPGLADLRLLDPADREVPFLFEMPRPPQRQARAAASVQTSLEEQRTVVAIETGFGGLVDGVEVRTAADVFIKAVRIEGVSFGASTRLHSTPIIFPSLRSTRSISAPPWVPQNRTPPVPQSSIPLQSHSLPRMRPI